MDGLAAILTDRDQVKMIFAPWLLRSDRDTVDFKQSGSVTSLSAKGTDHLQESLTPSGCFEGGVWPKTSLD